MGSLSQGCTYTSSFLSQGYFYDILAKISFVRPSNSIASKAGILLVALDVWFKTFPTSFVICRSRKSSPFSCARMRTACGSPASFPTHTPKLRVAKPGTKRYRKTISFDPSMATRRPVIRERRLWTTYTYPSFLLQQSPCNNFRRQPAMKDE